MRVLLNFNYEQLALSSWLLNQSMHNNNALSDTNVVQQTKRWIDIFVLGLKLCPFAPPIIKNNTAHYAIFRDDKLSAFKVFLGNECTRLINDNSIETTFIITPESFLDYDKYLKVLDRANNWLLKLDPDALFQIASFHPDYQFANTNYNDNENFTNRSPFPIFHLLREGSITKAVDSNIMKENIGEKNAAMMKKMDYNLILKLQNDIKR